MEINKLYQMDAIKFLKELPDNFVDVVITDPPYFQPAQHYSPSRKQIFTQRCISDLSILEHFFKSFLIELVRVTKKDGFIYVFCDSQSYPLIFAGLYSYVRVIRTIVWNKVTAFNAYTWRHQHELIAYAEMPDAEKIPTSDGDIIKERVVELEKRVHPAEKPIKLIDRIVKKHKDKNLFLDCFAGSGNIPIAIKHNGKNFIACESQESYFQIAQQRIEQAKTQTLLTQPANAGDIIIAKSNKIEDFTSDEPPSESLRTFANAKGI